MPSTDCQNSSDPVINGIDESTGVCVCVLCVCMCVGAHVQTWASFAAKNKLLELQHKIDVYKQSSFFL